MQLPPSPALADLIRHYLVIEYASLTGPGTYRFFPDGSPGIVFSFADPLTGAALPASSFVYGQTSRHSDLAAVGNLGLLIVVFQPWGLYGLTGIPGTETVDLRVGANDFFRTDEIGERLQECSSWRDRIRLLEILLTQRRKLVLPDLQGIPYVVSRMNAADEPLSIRSLAEASCLTERTLERRFHQLVGMSPKPFSRILRLQKSLKMKRLQPDLSLMDVACKAGYYDQAHYIREFSDLTGLTPGQYLANPGRLAANLLPV